MPGINETIEKLLVKIGQMSQRGEYRRAYICSRNILGIVKTTDAGAQMTARVLIASAKSAYYFSRFGESENHLNSAANLLKINRLDCDNQLHRDMMIIRSNILRRRGDYRGALEIIRNCPKNPEQSEFSINRMMITGLCLMKLGRTDQARKNLEAALGLATHSGNERGRCGVLSSIGLLSMSGGYLANAADYFRRAADISRRIGDRYNRGTASLNCSIAAYRRGYFTPAQRDAEEALSAFQECEWKPGICRSYLALGNIERLRGNYKQARMMYRKADSIAESSGLLREKALAAGYDGQVWLAWKKYGEAENALLSSLSVINEVNPGSDIALEQNRILGKLKTETGDFSKAQEYLETALKISRDIKAGTEEGLVYWNMAELSYLSRDFDSGKKLFEKAAGILRASGCDMDLAAVKLSYAENLFKYDLDRDDLPSSADRETVNKIWHLLIETSHIAGAIETDSLRERIEHFLDQVYSIRKSFPSSQAARVGSAYVEVAFSPEFIIHQDIVSVSGLMRDVIRDVELAASCESPVLITGETGTGKELVARAVHNVSERSEGNFVAVNCSAVPYRLFESEFFGHRKGSFSGAGSDRKGLFEEASGGSLFLDEIGELDPVQQAKLLRVLQEGKVRRVGENTEREVDLRLISATNRDLEKKIENGSMRRDFFFRINEEIIRIPPLRERREDIVPLMAFCLCGNGNGNGDRVRIEKQALKLIQRYPWPGNVREFVSVIRRVSRINRGGVITADSLPERIKGSGARLEAGSLIGGRGGNDRKRTLLKLLKTCNGNKTEVARWLGISRGTLYKELKQAGLNHLIG